MNADIISRQGWAVVIGLGGAQMLSAAGQMTLVTLSGIIGALLAPTPQLATLPVAIGVVGLALAALPVALLIRRFGRRIVFALSACWSAAGAVVCAGGITNGSFSVFCLGCFMIGTNLAAMAQYRFAVADSVPVSMISRAVSAIMLGTLVAALIAPWLALESRNWLAVEYAGSFAILVVPLLMSAAIVALLPLPPEHAHADSQHVDGSLVAVLKNPNIQLAIISASMGYAVMSLIMTATPISMHVMDGMSVEVTANVIRAHMFAMFLPSFFSGWLIARIGVIPALWIGLLLMAGTVLITFAGQAEAYYMVALVLLGAGWNFLFIGGTTLLASASRGVFKYRVQGINEMVMFGTMAVGSLVAGPLLHNFGWVTMNLVGGALLLLVVVAILRARTGVRFNDEQLSVRTQSD